MLCDPDSGYVIDPSGRTLRWVLFNETVKTKPDLQRSKLMLCPRPQPGHVPVATRPFAYHNGNALQMGDELHAWLKENEFPYQIDHRWCGMTLGWHAGFVDDLPAVAFRLAWGI